MVLFSAVMSVFAENRVYSVADLQRVSVTDLWSAICTLEPSFMQSVENSGVLHEKKDNITVFVDGIRTPLSMLQGMSVNDVEEVKIVKDPVALSQMTINGGEGVLVITTKKNTSGPLQVSYRLDASTQSAHKYLDEGAHDLYGRTYQTGWTNNHQLDIQGGDKFVGYKFTAIYNPGSRGVLKGNEQDRLTLRSFISYNRKALKVHNDILFNDYNTQSALVEPTFGSFDKNKGPFFYDHFGASLQIAPSLMLEGSFAYQHQQMRRDLFMSPQLPVFDSEEDLRNRGTYHIMREKNDTYEGNLQLNFDSCFNQKHHLMASAGVNIYSGELRGESFGGRGILNDMLSYVTFTQMYDTLQAPQATRTYDHTLQGNISATYEYDSRWALTLSGNIVHSSLLAPENRTKAYWGARAKWNMDKEEWMKGSAFDYLTLALSAGTSAVVPFDYHSFRTTYTNDTKEEYIYNYYQTGAYINGMTNESLLPVTVSRQTFTVSAGIKQWNISLMAYRTHCSDLFCMKQTAITDGFIFTPENDGSNTVSGMDAYASRLFTTSNGAKWGATMALGYGDWGMLRASLLTHLNVSGWTGALSFTARGEKNDNRLQLQSLQIGHVIPQIKRFISGGDITISGENLFTWHSHRMTNTFVYPSVRSVNVMLNIRF